MSRISKEAQIAQLRKRVEAVLADQPHLNPSFSELESQRLLHELQVYQLELEMQNESLLVAQNELEDSRDRYAALYDTAPVGYITLDSDSIVQAANRTCATMLGTARRDMLGAHFPNFVDREDRDQFYLYHKALFENSSQQSQFLRLLRKDRSSLYVQLEGKGIASETANFVNITIADITEHKQRLLLKGLLETMLVVTSSLDLPQVLDHILTQVRLVIPYDAANIMLIEGEAAYIAHSQGIPVPEDALKRRFSLEETAVLREMYFSGTLTLHVNVDYLSPMQRTLKQNWSRAYVGVPIRFRDKTVGFLNLNSMEPIAFTSAHTEWLKSFAAQSAIAIHNAQTHKQAQSMAVAEERHRLSRDLHDAISQNLFSASILTETFLRKEDAIGDDLRTKLTMLNTLIRGAMAEMRMLLLELRPEQMAKINIKDQIRHLTEALKARKQVQVHLDITGDFVLPAEVHVNLYRIAQESLNNIVRYSQANQVWVQLSLLPEKQELHVRDNGKGFDLKRDTLGIGLLSMQERAQTIGATFEITSDKGQGTQIHVVRTATSL